MRDQKALSFLIENYATTKTKQTRRITPFTAGNSGDISPAAAVGFIPTQYLTLW